MPPAPVVVILHGTHPGCPLDEAGVDRLALWTRRIEATPQLIKGLSIWYDNWRDRGVCRGPRPSTLMPGKHLRLWESQPPNERVRTIGQPASCRLWRQPRAGGENNFGVKLTDRGIYPSPN